MTASPLDAAHETTRRITTLSVATAVLLIVMKAFALGASGSVSILASLADSALDLVASLATFFAVRWAAAPPDDEHRYGHGKAEGLASLVQAGMVLASGVFIGFVGVWLFSITDSSARAAKDRAAFPAQQVRSETGLGASGASGN